MMFEQVCCDIRSVCDDLYRGRLVSLSAHYCVELLFSYSN